MEDTHTVPLIAMFERAWNNAIPLPSFTHAHSALLSCSKYSLHVQHRIKKILVLYYIHVQLSTGMHACSIGKLNATYNCTCSLSLPLQMHERSVYYQLPRQQHLLLWQPSPEHPETIFWAQSQTLFPRWWQWGGQLPLPLSFGAIWGRERRGTPVPA